MTKHILVVNDTEEILQLFHTILHDDAGYEVTLGTYKPGLVEWVKAAKPDLIISDQIFGQEKLGFQFVDMLKMDPATAHMPVIICSGAISALREREAYLAEKNVSVVYKPFDVEELLSAVKHKLGE